MTYLRALLLVLRTPALCALLSLAFVSEPLGLWIHRGPGFGPLTHSLRIVSFSGFGLARRLPRELVPWLGWLGVVLLQSPNGYAPLAPLGFGGGCCF